MKLFYVECNKGPMGDRNRKDRVFRWFTIAESAEAAIAKVKAHDGGEDGDWSADEDETGVASIRLVFR